MGSALHSRGSSELPPGKKQTGPLWTPLSPTQVPPLYFRESVMPACVCECVCERGLRTHGLWGGGLEQYFYPFKNSSFSCISSIFSRQCFLKVKKKLPLCLSFSSHNGPRQGQCPRHSHEDTGQSPERNVNGGPGTGLCSLWVASLCGLFSELQKGGYALPRPPSTWVPGRQQEMGLRRWAPAPQNSYP